MILETICLEKSHCVACRSDKVWRLSLMIGGVVTERDFECPHGITILNAGQVQAVALSEKTGNSKYMTEEFKRLAAECGGCNQRPDPEEDVDANKPND